MPARQRRHRALVDPRSHAAPISPMLAAREGYARSRMSPRADAPDQLRVAMLAPISWRVPPRHYGPWEQFVSLLTEGLVERGVDVTLFATADSLTTAKLVSVVERGYSEDPGAEPKVCECMHIAQAFERA